MRIVAVRFASLIRAIVDGSVDQEALDKGIFFLDVTRAHAMNPAKPVPGVSPDDSNELRWDYFRDHNGVLDGDAAGDCQTRIVSALAKATDDGRIGWWKGEEGKEDHPDPFQLLSGLLVRHGYPTIHAGDSYEAAGLYCSAGVDERIHALATFEDPDVRARVADLQVII